MSILPERHVWDTQKKINPLSPQKENLSSVSQRHVYKTQKYARDMTHSETWLTQRQRQKSHMSAHASDDDFLVHVWDSCIVPHRSHVSETWLTQISGVFLGYDWYMSELCLRHMYIYIQTYIKYIYLYIDIQYISIYRYTLRVFNI